MAALNAPDCSALGLNMNNANIMGRRMFRPHSAPVAMQAGGMAQMMPPEAMMPPAMPPGPPPEAMMPPAAMPPPTEEEGVATLMTEQGIDPAMMEQMLASASENFGNLDTAEDFEQAMNAIRGDQASVTERRGELAELVGPEDANRTPESVLTLVQPVMMLAEVDQGIGGLAQGEMTEPVTGDMAGGIMSTVDMGGAPEAPAPVNFNQGGAVQRFADPNSRVAGVPDPNLDPFGQLFTSRRDLLRQYVTPSTSAEQLAEQKKLTEAQMLFDLANAGLQLAQPGPPGENFLGAVSRAATDSQLLDKVGARAQAQFEAEKAVDKEKQALDLMAFKSAEDIALAQQKALLRDPQKQENFLVGNSIIGAVPGTARYNTLTAGGFPAMGDVSYSDLMAAENRPRTQYTLTKPVTLNKVNYAAGSSPFFTNAEVNSITSSFGADALTSYQEPITDKDFFSKFGHSKEGFEALPKETQQFLQGLPVLTDVDYFDKFGMSKAAFLGLDQGIKDILLDIEPKYQYKTIEDGNVRKLVQINERTGVTTDLDEYDVFRSPKIMQVTMLNDDGVPVTTAVDVNTRQGQALLDKAVKANTANPGSANVTQVATMSRTPTLYLDPATSTSYMSRDGGRTYVTEKGEVMEMPGNVIKIESKIAVETYRNAAQRKKALQFLKDADAQLAANMFVPVHDANGNVVLDDDGKPKQRKLTKEELGDTNKALEYVALGSGFYSNLFAAINGVVGGLTDSKALAQMFKEDEQARQFVRMLRVMGRSALSSSPRFAVADLETTQQLFPNEANFFVNPESEIDKLQTLVRYLSEEERRINQDIVDGMTDKTLRGTYVQKLSEIRKLKNILGPLDFDLRRRRKRETGVGEAVAEELMRRNQNR